jgi:hypothetical protein
MMKKLFMILIVLVVFTLMMGLFSKICLGDELGMHGKIGFTYELMPYSPGQTWFVDIYYNFTNWLTIGAKQTTYTSGFYQIGFIPTNQLYEIYLKIDIGKNCNVQICQWCDHPVYNGFTETSNTVPEGLYVKGTFSF